MLTENPLAFKLAERDAANQLESLPYLRNCILPGTKILVFPRFTSRQAAC